MADAEPQAPPHMPFGATQDLTHGEIASAIFNARMIEAGYAVLQSEDWATRARAIDYPGERVFVGTSRWGRREIIRDDELLVDVSLMTGHASVAVAARSEVAAASAVDRLRELLPAPDPSGAQEVTVTFWTYGPHGPQPSWRTISVPTWAEIEHNYSSSTTAGLTRLMTDFQPAHGGQLVLWHGAVGTGKTFALRALAWEWRDWCDIHYIVDPDSFFGQHADYLMHVILQTEWEGQFVLHPAQGALGAATSQITLQTIGGESAREANGADDDAMHGQKGWRLLVLEDTGELLQPDAKAIIGQGLSRFLNLADGLIGQGLRVLVLVTTNEEIRKLHPAVARPGRSAANVRFDPLTPPEASVWLARKGHEEDVPGSGTTIAELYARVEGLEVPKQSVGFEES